MKYTQKGPKETKGRPFGILFLLMLLAAGAIFVYFWKTSLENQVSDLRDAIAFIQSEYSFAEIEMLEKSANSIRFELSIIDLGGYTVDSSVYTLEGTDIFLESKVILAKWEEGERAFIFPYKLYSDTIAEVNGTDITSLYIDDGTPLIYSLPAMSSGLQSAMANIYQTAFGADIYEPGVTDEYITDIFDTAVHQSPARPFQAGKTYRYIIHPNGGVELLEGN